MDRLGWHSLNTTFDCDCGHAHALPIHTVYQGIDAAQRLAAFAREHCDTHGLLISDENTQAAGGEEVLRALGDVGKKITHELYGSDPFEATQSLGDEVTVLAAQADFIVAVGSGTLCDLAKYAGDKLDIPVLLYATAASMNGYTSAVAALKVRGLKRTLPCKPATAVFANPEHAATAPTRMTAAGLADFLSKCSSSTDWRAAHLLQGVYFCERPREFFEGTQDQLLASAALIPEGDPEAIQSVMEALLLSGCSMVIAGSSAPASGGEHLISHYLDMKAALYDLPNDLHGTQVGVATVHCLGLWEKVLALNPGDIDIETLITRQHDDSEIAESIDQDWGPVAPEVQEQWNKKKMNADELRVFLEKFKQELPRLKRELPVDLLPAQIVEKAIKEAGGPTTPEGLHAPIEEYTNALSRARYIRDRFTILDLAADLFK